MEEKNKLIGVRLKKLRGHKGLTLQKLASLSNCTRGYLSSIESGNNKPSPQMLNAIARALSTTPRFLTEGGDEAAYPILDLVDFVESSGTPEIKITFKKLMNRLFVLEIGRKDSALRRKEEILNECSEQLKEGRLPKEITKDIEALERTMEEIEERVSALSVAMKI